MPTLLKGNFDLLITGGCTLSCKGCSYLDYLDLGNTICSFIRPVDLELILEKLANLDLILESLTLLGGEPTLHPELDMLAEIGNNYKNKSIKNLYLHTNGTFLNNKFASSIEFFDKIILSSYPTTRQIVSEIEKTNFFKKYYKKFYHKEIENFLDYGTKRDALEYNEFLNFSRCKSKEKCRVITVNGIYRCFVSYNNKKDICDFKSKEKLIQYINNDDTPLESCKNCPWPPREVKWRSNNEKKDAERVKQGLKYIKELDNYA